MKITFVQVGAALTGGQRVVANLARHLIDNGHDVTVVGVLPPAPSFRQCLSSLARKGRWPDDSRFRDSTYFTDLSVKVRFVPPGVTLHDYAELPNADVIIATWWETAEWVASLPDSKGAKVYFLQGYEVLPRLPIMRVKATYRLRMHKIAVSQWLADLMRRDYADNNVTVVPNGIDTQSFHAPPRTRQPVPTFGFVYSRLACKGSDIIAQAVQLARRQRPDIRIRSFGSSDPGSGCPLPRGTEFELRPAQARLRDIYAGCDAWLFASRAEGFGLPILEAMACRTPVIGTAAGAAPEILASGGGRLIDRESPAALASAILECCEMDEPVWRRMSDAAHRTACGYSWGRSARLFEDALHAAVGCSPLTMEPAHRPTSNSVEIRS